ncbi:MAG: hypothetical protein Kow0031_09110 [Anaerolineae bacterium]
MSPEQKTWNAVLSQLQLQMTNSTYDTLFKGTHLVSTTDNIWQVAVANTFAQDWLKNRLYDTILRVASNEVGVPADQLSLQFVMVQPVDGHVNGYGGNGNNGHTVGSAINPADRWLPDGSSPYARFTPTLEKINSKTGYYPLPRFYLEFWEMYLTCRWKRAGSRAFMLRQKLLSQDTRKIRSDEFSPWTPVIETSFEALARLIATNRAAISGRRSQCQQYELERDLGQPRGEDCCGRHAAAGCRIELAERGVRQPHCYFWRAGVLEVLSLEKMVMIEQLGNTRGHQVRLQVYHSLPAALTPFQAAFLPEPLQEQHRAWLMRYSKAMDWSLASWEATPGDVETFIDYDPGWAGTDRMLDGQYHPNPYLTTPSQAVIRDMCHV